VELWFAQIQREVIARGVFTSAADLGRKLRRYLRAYSKSAKPFRWTYTDPSRRITTNRITETAYLDSLLDIPRTYGIKLQNQVNINLRIYVQNSCRSRAHGYTHC
jgi:hypothetical protein